MAKIHDHVMRGEREKGWGGGVDTIWKEGKKRNAVPEEKKGMDPARWEWAI